MCDEKQPQQPSKCPSSQPPPAQPPTAPSHNLAEPSTDHNAVQALRTLSPLVDNLENSLTCSICLGIMEDAHQLQCSHVFCPACITTMLSTSQARCPICKQKTAKRMLSPIISFAQATASLRSLREILQQCDISQEPVALNQSTLKDGFDTALSSAVSRIRNIQREQALRLKRIEQNHHQQEIRAPRVCALCPKGIDPSFFSRSVQFGRFIPAPSTLRKSALFAHENCSMYTPGVYQLDDTLQGVDAAISINSNVICQRSACGRSRATIDCCSPSCSKKYHFACAVVEKCIFIEDGYKMFCVQHANESPNIDEKQFNSALSDPSGKISLSHDDVCYICSTGGRLLMCDTCERCTHPACSALRTIPHGSWNCAVCTGKQPVTNLPTRRGDNSRPPNTECISSKKRRRAEPTVQVMEHDDQFASSLTPSSAKRPRSKSAQRKKTDSKKRMVLSHTGLLEEDRELLRSVAKAKKTIVKEDVDSKVTHLVIRCLKPTENPLRTMKLCKAIASRARIVCWSWVQESCNTRHWAPFESYLHQLSWEQHKDAVYANLNTSFCCYNGPREKKEELMSLVQMGGGTVVQREAGIGNGADDALVYVREEDTKKNSRREQFSRLEPPRGARVVTSGWLLDLCTKNRMD